MTLKEYVSQSVADLSEVELAQVAEYLDFLKFRASQVGRVMSDNAHLAALYAEFSAEDRLMAEVGIDDYYQGLMSEDAG